MVRLKKILLAAASILLVAFLFMTTEVESSTEYRLPKIKLAGIDVSGMTLVEAEYALEGISPNIILQTPDGECKLCNFNQIGTVSYMDCLKSIEETGVLLDPVWYYSDKALNNKVSDFVRTYNYTKRPPKNAEIIYDDHKFKKIEEEPGNILDEEKVLASIQESLDNRESKIDISGCVEEADITLNDLEFSDEMKAVNDISGLTLNLEGGKTEIITEETLRSWLIYNNEEIELNEDLIRSYVRQLALKYDTFGSKRTFLCHSGEKIEIGGSVKDTFGYQMDIDGTTKAIADALLTVKEADCKWINQGKERTDENDFGNTYVEVSISEQKLWYYKDGQCVLETDVVTGDPRHGGTTPGAFKILYKESPAILRGDDYETHVSYWMPVTYTGTGLHDASWRSSFGRTIYQGNGSHGCVNMPTRMARDLFGMIETDTPVIIY